MDDFEGVRIREDKKNLGEVHRLKTKGSLRERGHYPAKEERNMQRGTGQKETTNGQTRKHDSKKMKKGRTV